ncbi:hypothetical protein ACFLRF_00575 [Candidatus Altiarchaeota archaeon]
MVDDFRVLRVGVLLALLLGIIAAAVLVWMQVAAENYSVIYLQPGSYSNYIEGDEVEFSYGIKTYGVRGDKYVLKAYLGDNFIAEKDLTQQASADNVVIKLPEGIEFPVKVRLVLETDTGENEVHFWLKGRKNEEK